MDRATRAKLEESPPGSITTWLVQKIASRAGISAADIDPRVHVAHYGLDSLASVELFTDAARTFGASIGASTLLEQPSIEASARLLAGGEPALGALQERTRIRMPNHSQRRGQSSATAG
jgi:acyl carrier protein